ncbi:hypothetical protein [Chitinophaga ginsengisoli]|uniref:Uncharacterized protein n=1 Tax=Chitinophaga ginsengisoli TaxID=363837 RepID=A0A2P8GCL2_9BACT|nr:hypothetical protein [Chitinophaga ginsengisoli]PSL31718.1 hypothetical protein CLV42_10410 [Chitinophaga ginsengisoli]
MPNENLKTDPYFSFFNELDTKGIRELFPSGPLSENLLDDINRRIFNFPYFWRKTLMAQMGWSVVVMFRKMQNRDPKDKIVEELTVPEKMMILKLTFRVLEVYQQYLLHEYQDLLTE